MLYQFLEENRSEIIALAEEKVSNLAGSLPSSTVLQRGLPIFYEHLIEYLKSAKSGFTIENIVQGAASHGKELMRLNYTLSHVVHTYGAMCQAVTEHAQRRKKSILTDEFNDLNMCLDIAISAAVSEFQFRSVKAIEEKEVQHLGFLVHELRNALSSATVAHEMIKQGIVGTSGSTSRVLGENLVRMRNLIDRSLSEVRLRADPEVHIEKFNLGALVDQIIITAESGARARQQVIANTVSSSMELETDRQLLLSILANLLQNALKYTKIGGKVTLRSGDSGKNIVIEIEDQCGGLSPELQKSLFTPFVSSGVDQSGLGLGLTIVKRATELLQGHIQVNNNPGTGCAFRIEIPKILTPKPLTRTNSGENSDQPTPNRVSKWNSQ